MRPTTLFVVIIIALVTLSIFLMMIFKAKMSTESSISMLIPNFECPKDADIEDYVDRMREFAPKDSPIAEPSYALDVFKRYLGCKNPMSGPSRFSTEEVNKYDSEIVSCARVAYSNYLEVLNEKKEQSKGYPDDVKYYAGEIATIKKEKKVFDAIFPASEYPTKMCNYKATGKA